MGLEVPDRSLLKPMDSTCPEQVLRCKFHKHHVLGKEARDVAKPQEFVAGVYMTGSGGLHRVVSSRPRPGLA